MKNYRQNLGDWGEQLAVKYLAKLGYRILNRKWRVREGEIDLIALEGNTLVFIEVKTRRSHLFGLAVESITPGKQMKMIKSIQKYLAQHINAKKRQIRIDVILIDLDKNSKIYLTHMKNPVIDCQE
ncbi:MAG: YraN family protein [Patescibacteria group bacterium]